MAPLPPLSFSAERFCLTRTILIPPLSPLNRLLSVAFEEASRPPITARTRVSRTECSSSPLRPRRLRRKAAITERVSFCLPPPPPFFPFPEHLRLCRWLQKLGSREYPETEVDVFSSYAFLRFMMKLPPSFSACSMLLNLSPFLAEGAVPFLFLSTPRNVNFFLRGFEVSF